jgi:YHS domain-containing protein
MLRGIIYLLISLLAITFIRMVIGILMKGASEMMRNGSASGTAGQTRGPSMPQGGTLKRDPICGTYVPESNSITGNVQGERYHYCSIRCRDKHAAARV